MKVNVNEGTTKVSLTHPVPIAPQHSATINNPNSTRKTINGLLSTLLKKNLCIILISIVSLRGKYKIILNQKKAVKIILFDGICNLCNGFVQFVIKRDTEKLFKFASFQSDFGQNFLKRHGLNSTKYSSFILLEEENYYTQSTAALRIIKALPSMRFTGKLLQYCPVAARDFFYRLIAKNRYLLFGKKEKCLLPTPELKERFLN